MLATEAQEPHGKIRAADLSDPRSDRVAAGPSIDPRQSVNKVLGSRIGYSSDDLPNLDFLRAVAVLLVLFSHLAYFANFLHFGHLRVDWMGTVGVYFFFVHTCFVLMLSLERQYKGKSAFQLFGAFMIRRIFRIYPLSVAAVLLIVLLHLPLAELSPRNFAGAPADVAQIASNLLLVQGPGRSLLSVMWSLPYEMAMYLFLPWFFLFLRPNRFLWRVAAILSIAVLAASLFLSFAGWPMRDDFIAYVPCFIPGVIAYQMQRTRHRKLPAAIWPCVVLLVIPLYLYEQNLIADFRVKSWILCLAIGLSVPFFAQLSARWITTPAYLIAKYSYGIYLTHTFCIWLAFDRLHGVLPRIACFGLFIVLAIALPIAFYHSLEEPMVRVGKRVAKRFESHSIFSTSEQK
jgi:peptidoglycan/LPS O-acetylase OafA/YrhL